MEAGRHVCMDACKQERQAGKQAGRQAGSQPPGGQQVWVHGAGPVHSSSHASLRVGGKLEKEIRPAGPEAPSHARITELSQGTTGPSALWEHTRTVLLLWSLDFGGVRQNLSKIICFN